jgi:RNA polymerase sigma-70 factor (ECF subfamily)
MSEEGPLRDVLEATYRLEARRVLATLIRLLGGFDAAEDALHDAFAAAAEQWPREGVPRNAYAWLVSAGRFKAINRWRRQHRLETALPDFARAAAEEPRGSEPMDNAIEDDELRLLFICCHPSLPKDARVALTLREVGGLTTEEIARAYLCPAPTIGQRISRAKAKIRDEKLPYEVPTRVDLPARLESVLSVIYLIFNEGYTATQGAGFTRDDLCLDALRLGRLIVALLPAETEALGLLALMLLHTSRRQARVDAAGDLVLLENQDRTRWDSAAIAEAQAILDQAMKMRRVGPYLLQAAIAAVHAEAPRGGATDWTQIVGLYDVLRRIDPSPVVELNRGVAVGMRDGAKAGLAAIEDVLKRGELDGYHLAHAALADMHRRLGHLDAARAAYQRALQLTRQDAERRFLEARLESLQGAD